MKFFDLEMDNYLAKLVTVYTKPDLLDNTCKRKDQKWSESNPLDCYHDGVVYSDPKNSKCKKYL